MRLKRFRVAKGIRTQGALAALTNVAQPHISELEKSATPSLDVLERLADRLDCTTDFLLGRGPFKDAIEPADVRDAASRMALDVFVASEANDKRREWCRRVLGHPESPVTAQGWMVLSEQIERAIGPSNGGSMLHSITGGKAG